MTRSRGQTQPLSDRSNIWPVYSISHTSEEGLAEGNRLVTLTDQYWINIGSISEVLWVGQPHVPLYTDRHRLPPDFSRLVKTFSSASSFRRLHFGVSHFFPLASSLLRTCGMCEMECARSQRWEKCDSACCAGMREGGFEKTADYDTTKKGVAMSRLAKVVCRRGENLSCVLWRVSQKSLVCSAALSLHLLIIVCISSIDFVQRWTCGTRREPLVLLKASQRDVQMYK